MYISRRFYTLVGIALIGIVLAVTAESSYVLHRKNEIVNLRDIRVQAVRESIDLHGVIDDLIQYSNTMGSSALSTDNGQIEEFDKFHNRLETLLEEASQQVKSYTPRDMQKWDEFLQRWNIWYINELGLLHRIEDVTSVTPSLTIKGFRKYITEERQDHLEMATGLRKSTIELIKESVRQADELLSIADDMNFIIGTKIVAALVLISMVALFYFSTRNYYKNHIFKIKALSLKATTRKIQKIDEGLEILCGGIRQVSADQINLFSLGRALERAQGGSFSGVSGETAALAEQAGVLANEVRMMADQIKALLGEVVVELQQAAAQTDLPGTPPNAQVDRLTSVLTTVTSAMNADPLQAMITPSGQVREV